MQIQKILKFMEDDTLFLKQKLRERLSSTERKSLIKEINQIEDCYLNFIEKHYK
jgi:hypothetical protein